MKIWLKTFLVAVAIVACMPVAARADAQDFTIQSFKADYYVSRDSANVSQMRVQETIVAVFPDFDQNHGILRAIPMSYQGHPLETNIESVADQLGKPYEYSQNSENDNIVLKIGNPDSFAKGQTTYVITYNLRGVIQDTGKTQELYWDINGDQWRQPFGEVQVVVHLSDDLKASELSEESTCYAGAFGATEHNCALEHAASGVTSRTEQLEPGETLTIVLSFQPDTFAPYSPTTQQKLEWAGYAALFALPPLIVLGVVLRNYWRFGRDPKDKTSIIPEYLPPKGVSVLMSAMVLHEQLKQAAPTATLLDMAVKHFIRIYEVPAKGGWLGSNKPTYELELVEIPKDVLSEEKTVLAWFFGKELKQGERVKLSALQNKFASKMTTFGFELGKTAAQQGYFTRPPASAKRPYLIWGIILVVGSFFFLPFTWGTLAAGVVCLVASGAMPARTVKGVELRNYLLGLKKYMQLAEADRLKAMQSPHGQLTQKVDTTDKKQLISLYEHLLPYALLFGIEKDWAKEFAGLYEQQPDWYSATGSFHAVAFANAMSGFSSAGEITFSSPSSSSGSGFSGGAGGGGGGGGGGGW